MNYISQQAISQFIDQSLHEDVGDGDHTSASSIPSEATGEAQLIIKGQGILAGMELAEKIFHQINPHLELKILLHDGDRVKNGDIALRVKGSVHSILKAERLVLNCMQRMSGIATLTHELTEIIRGTGARLLDTRKTTPNFRMMEKWAVAIGGGTNHRFGLFDMILLKDNHVDYAGGISKAIQSARNYLQKTGKNLPIEIETRNLQEVQEALQTGGIDRIMLDNMPVDMIKEALAMINKQYQTEASGGITRESILEIARTGVDYISVGALTHSIKSMDMSLKAVRGL